MTLAERPSTLFFIHSGPLAPYVQASILQARSADPGSSVVLIGDQAREKVPREILTETTYELMDNCSAQANTFARIFRFEGNNSFEYELLNFQRWFYVRSYCEAHSVAGPILVLDSDAYLYVAVSEVAPHLSTSMTVVDKVGPQFTFFLTVQALTDFTTFLTESFSTDRGFERLAKFVRESDDAGVPHVSDMAAFGVYAREHKLEDLGASNRKDVIFCENIGSQQGLVMNPMGKKVTKRHGRRYFTTLEGSKVLAGGVHLQGGNKDLWPYFVDHTVRTAVRRSSPHDYSHARRTARQKAFRIGLLKASARARNLFPRRLNRNR